MIEVLAIIIPIGGIAFLSLRHLTFRKRARSLIWPASLSTSATCRHARLFLKSSGWEILPEWDWLNIRVRARRQGTHVNLLVPEQGVQSLKHVLIDADEVANKNNTIITVLLPTEDEDAGKALPETPRVLVIAPWQLADVEELVRTKQLELASAESVRQGARVAGVKLDECDDVPETAPGQQQNNQAPLDQKEGAICGRLKEMLENKLFDEAEHFADSARTAHPGSQAIWLQYCLIAYARGEFAEASRRLSDKPDTIASSVDERRYLAASYRLQKLFVDADAILATALTDFPGRPALLLERAWTSTQSGEIDEARRRWAELRANFPNHHESFWVASNLALRQGDFQEAEEICTEGYSRFPRNGHMLWQRALSASRRRDWAEAEKRWLEAWALYPEMHEIQNGYSQFKIERKSVLGGEGNSDKSEHQASVAHNQSSLFSRFESIGGNCEFGIIQRSAGIEPLGLLRWAGIRPDQLTRLLLEKFEGVGTPEYTNVMTNEHGEYIAQDKRYFEMHTFVHFGQATPEEMLNQTMTRSRYLARKLCEDLVEAKKIFVYSFHQGRLANEQIAAIFSALRHYGSNSLLCVHKAPAGPGAPRTQRLGSGLYLAAMPELNDHPQAARSRNDAWVEICTYVVEDLAREGHEDVQALEANFLAAS